MDHVVLSAMSTALAREAGRRDRLGIVVDRDELGRERQNGRRDGAAVSCEAVPALDGWAHHGEDVAGSEMGLEVLGSWEREIESCGKVVYLHKNMFILEQR